MNNITLPMAALYLSTSLSIVHAATERDLDSHVHGGAGLNIAIEDQQLFIEFASPWMNLVGFEHKPATDEQRTAVADATQRLENADGLFEFTGTECVLSESDVESSMTRDEGQEEGGPHSALVASYVFDCTDMSKLDALNVGLFDMWTGIEDVDVQLIGPAGQSAVELMPGSTTLGIASVR